MEEYTDEDFEYDKELRGTAIRAQVAKVGGGTVGKRYHGKWIVRLSYGKALPQRGRVILEADDLVTPSSHPVNHEGAARVAMAFWVNEEGG
jgi:hypothetical protein